MPPRSSRRTLRSRALTPALLAAGLLAAGCSGAGPGASPLSGLSGGASAAPYVQSTIYSPTGYNSKQIDDTHFVVRADGTGGTSAQRLQRMAEARAAELGPELGFAWYKIEGSDAATTCGKKVEGYKGPGAAHNHMRSHKLTVAYAKTQADPSYQQAAPAFALAKAALDADVPAPEEAAAGEAELKRACDKR